MIRRFWKASRLIEILTVSALLVLLGTLTVPYFDRFKCRSKQSEARMELKKLARALLLYEGETGRLLSLDDLLAKKIVRLQEKYYYYDMSYLSGSDFEIRAVSRKDAFSKLDVWSIDQSNKLQHLENACRIP